MHSDTDNIRPFEQLRKEHRYLLVETARLERKAGGTEMLAESTMTDMSRILRLLELHQDAEDRFLLPLVPCLDKDLLAGIREDHIAFLRCSDELAAAAVAPTGGLLLQRLSSFGKKLEKHFMMEESALFSISAEILSPAQLDILRIKFAGRTGVEV